MSNSFSTLGEGLVIQRDGKIWECVKLFDDTLQFQLPDTGELLNIGQGDLITEISNQVTTIVEAHSSRDVLTYDVDQSTSETITTVLGLPDKYVRQVDFRMLFIEGAIKRKISRGQLALLEECIEEVCAEIKKGELVTPAPAVVNPPERRRRHCAPRHQTHQGKAKDLTEWKPSAISVSRWMQKYESRRRELSALVSGHCHRARPTLIGEEAFEHVDRSIYLHYAIAEAPKRSAAYGKYKDWLKTENQTRAAEALKPIACVSANTYGRAIEKKPAVEMIELREGKEAARKAERLQRGHMPGVSPLDFVEIDHAMLDIFVVDDRCCLPLGRPWVTVMVDRSSGVVLGIYVSFYGACLHSIYGCLRHSLWPHPQIRELWPDIENDWVSWGRGTYYVSDRGADFLSPRYRHAIRMMGGFTEYCEARTPWHKPSIERFMGTMSSLFETMPGKAFSSIDLRGDYDPIKHSVVRFTSLVYLLHKWVADSHNVSAKSSRQARRIDIWNDGMENAPLIIPREPEKIDVALGDWYDGSLRHDGIRHKYLNYANSEMLREVLKRHGEGCNVKFVVNRSNRGSIHVQDPDSLALFRVPALRQDYAEGLTDFQHDYFRKELGDKLKPATAIDQLISVQRSIRDTLASDLIARENSQKVKLARIADINSSSVLARETRSILDLVKEPELAPPPALIIPPSFTEVPKITWGV